MLGRARDALVRRVRGLGSRLLLVNAVVLVVPWAGLEYARWHERQLLHSLERDMRDQAALVRATLEDRLAHGGSLDDEALGRALTEAARSTRTRIRVLDTTGAALLDSHGEGAPEGPERPVPTILSSVLPSTSRTGPHEWVGESRSRYPATGAPWQVIPARPEVRAALAGHPSAFTRVRDSEPQVILFITEPVRGAPSTAAGAVAEDPESTASAAAVPDWEPAVVGAGDPDTEPAAVGARDDDAEPAVVAADDPDMEPAVVGVVYVTRSTQPVMVQLYLLRWSLIKLLALSLAITIVVTLVLGWTITRPLERLATAARRISAGEREVAVPRVGSGEIREVADAFAAMVEDQDARVRYVSEFTADVAHELKSPLTSIRGAAELLREGAFDDEAARSRFLRNIELDAERLDRLVSRLLELSRIDASTEPLVPVALDEVVGKVVERTQSAEQPVTVSGVRGATVRGRPLDLERALLNLVENAIRFSPPGAPVRIEVGEPRGSRDRSGRREDGNVGAETIELAVADDGPGVPADVRSRVFERFFTTDTERTGTGLGLAIVKSVAEACGGSAHLEPTERGARFVLALRRTT